ncbi:hypothetical protein ACAX61_02390 [Sphingomonas sp. IW22]
MVRDASPITWVPDGVEVDPLALEELYKKHVEGAFVPKGKGKVLHLLVKFPESVPVTEEADARAALQLAVDFAQKLFGGAAVFAARMDRDEASLTNADLFLAPRYEKKTKHESKVAISLSRHLKNMTAKRGMLKDNREILRCQGAALQDEFSEYLRSRGYQAMRGQAKKTRSTDWVTPELYGAKRDRQIAEVDRIVAKDFHAEAERLEAAAKQRRADTEAWVAQERRKLDILRTQLWHHAQKLYNDAVDQERIRAAAEADADQRRKQGEAASAAMLASSRQAAQDAKDASQRILSEAAGILAGAKQQEVAVEQARQQAQHERADAAAMKRAAAAELASAARIRMDNEAAREQLALLVRAMHDECLQLATEDSERGFRMAEAAMNLTEKQAYRAKWSQVLRDLAIQIAHKLRQALKKAMTLRKERIRFEIDQTELLGQKAALDADRAKIETVLQHAHEFRTAFEAIPEAERVPSVTEALRKGSVLEQSATIPKAALVRAKGPRDGPPQDAIWSQRQGQSR